MITGIVTGPQKAAVAHAKVEVVEDATAQGIVAGESQNASTFGSHSMNTFDPRQMMLEVRELAQSSAGKL